MIKGFKYYGSMILGYKLAIPKNYRDNKSLVFSKKEEPKVEEYTRNNYNYSKTVHKVMYR